MADIAPALARYAEPELAVALRSLLGHATVHLLGATISVTEDDWRARSALPDWTRGHVATHLARNAEALGRLVTGSLTGEPAEMYPSAESRDADIAAGAGRDGQELQTDLDTTAAELDGLFERVAHEAAWDRTVSLRGIAAPVGALVAARLTEVVLHHVDLGLGAALADVDEQTLTAVLDWVVGRLGSRIDQPVQLVVGDRGWLVGTTQDDAVEVSGTAAELLGWLTGRGPAPDGATGITPPPF